MECTKNLPKWLSEEVETRENGTRIGQFSLNTKKKLLTKFETSQLKITGTKYKLIVMETRKEEGREDTIIEMATTTRIIITRRIIITKDRTKILTHERDTRMMIRIIWVKVKMIGINILLRNLKKKLPKRKHN